MKDAKKADTEQVAAGDIEQKTSVLDVTQHSTAGDEVSSHQAKSQDHEPQRILELDASERKETAASDSSKIGSQNEDDDDKKLHDSGQPEASQKVEEEQTDDPLALKQRELQIPPESNETASVETSALHDGDGRIGFSTETSCEHEVSEQDVGEMGTSVEQHDVSGSCEGKTGKSEEQQESRSGEQEQDDDEDNVSSEKRQDDADEMLTDAQENVSEERGQDHATTSEDIISEVTDEQHTVSRL